MGLNDDKQFTQEFAGHLVNKDVAAAARMLAPDVVYRASGFPEIKGAGAWASMMNDFIQDSPDLNFAVEDIVAENSPAAAGGKASTVVATRYTWNTVHVNEFMGVPPTGRKLSVTAIAMYRMVDGLITEITVLDDYLSLFRQLGSIPISFFQDRIDIPGVGVKSVSKTP